MSDFFTLKHSFNAGDLLTVLPGLQHLFKETGKKTVIYQRIGFPAYYYDLATHPIKDKEGFHVCQNEETFEMLRPLIEEQDYVEKFEVWEGQQVDFDIDITRDSKMIPMPAGEIHSWTWAVYPELCCDLSLKWINANERGTSQKYDNESYGNYIQYFDKVIVNRTERYYNPYITYFFLKEYQDKILFSGLADEHKKFCEQWKLDIPRLEINNFLQLAKVISSCKFFVGNQSLNFHLADAQKVNRILELTPQFPNTFPTGKNGYSFYKQSNLEYFFNKLMNETT